MLSSWSYTADRAPNNSIFSVCDDKRNEDATCVMEIAVTTRRGTWVSCPPKTAPLGTVAEIILPPH